MRNFRVLLVANCIAATFALATALSSAQTNSTSIKTAELVPATQDITVGQKVKFSAVVKDAHGNQKEAPATAWFAAPFDVAGGDQPGFVSFFSAGDGLVGAIVGGKPVLTHVMVKPGAVSRIE